MIFYKRFNKKVPLHYQGTIPFRNVLDKKLLLILEIMGRNLTKGDMETADSSMGQPPVAHETLECCASYLEVHFAK